MLLKVGISMMAFAFAFAAVTAGIAVGLRDEPKPAIAAKPASKSVVEPLIRSYPPEEVKTGEAQVKPGQNSAPESAREVVAEPAPEPRPQPQMPAQSKAQPKSQVTSEIKSEPSPETKPEPNSAPEEELLPLAEGDWPAPTDEELQAIHGARHYKLPPGAIMGLTIKAMGLYNVPVLNDDSQWAFARGVVHEPETSLPWSNGPQRNVFLAAHRLGYYGTSSRLVFFNLDRLEKGDTIMLNDRSGKTYTYRVSETFVVDPTDTWVMGQVLGKDILTLQTCTPIPTFDKRLIVRANRV